MKKYILTTIGVMALATAVLAATQIKTTGAGLSLGTDASQKIGFYGVTPTNQLTVTVGSDSQTLTNILNALIKIGLVKTN